MLVGSLALVLVPAWTAVDRVLAPGQLGLFLLVRLLCDVPILLTVGALWFLPIGRRQPERLTYLIPFAVQAEVGWMALRASDVSSYLLGLTVAIDVSGCVLVARPGWTVRLVAVSWLALLTSALTTPMPVSVGEIVSVTVYLGPPHWSRRSHTSGGSTCSIRSFSPAPAWSRSSSAGGACWNSLTDSVTRSP